MRKVELRRCLETAASTSLKVASRWNLRENRTPEGTMWTETTRLQRDCSQLRYGSDLTDGEWNLVTPCLPAEAATGRPRAWPMGEILNALFYVLRSGCP